MKNQFKIQFLNLLNGKKRDKGFTLIELLIVIIIMGILGAIALPNLISQVAKGRQAEAKNNLGVINRAQQTYRLEEQTFSLVNDLPIKLSWQYYGLTSPGVADVSYQVYFALPLTSYRGNILSYAAAVYQANGVFNSVICEEDTVGSGYLPTPDLNATGCRQGKKVIK